MKKKVISILLTCSFLAISGICYSCSHGNEKKSENFVTDLLDQPTQEEGNSIQVVEQDSLEDEIIKPKELEEPINEKAVLVHICGAVDQPGVYEAMPSARVVDLIHLAGGLKTTAAGDYINQAMYVTDGQRIYIPTLEEVEAMEGIPNYDLYTQEEVSSKEDTLININTANKEELMTLPGIGEAKSKSIVEYRDTHGNFKVVKDLMNIPGIKDGLFQKISAYITVN